MTKNLWRSWWRQHWLQVLAVVGAVAAFVLVWWLVPPHLYTKVHDESARVKAITDTRTAFLAGLVGLGALGTFWINSRVHRITAQTFQVTQRGHVTDRYAKAIEYLGEDSLDVRLGGIYALEQIARESDQAKEDQATIVQVLSAFARVHSDPIYRYKASLSEDQTEWASTLSDEEFSERVDHYVEKATKLPEDVQAAVTVLGRLPHLEMIPRGDLTEASLRHVTLHTDLTGADLSETDLTSANLTRAKLAKTDFSDSKLIRANLAWADLTEAKLRRTHLIEASLVEADLTGADLTSAYLSRADLANADLTKARLTGALLVDANLAGANLTGARLFGAGFIRTDLSKAKLIALDLTEMDAAGADLTKAELGDAKLVRARLIKADLTGADLTKADLTGADLTKAKLAGANLARARLIEADLTGADLTNAILTGADLTKAKLTGANLTEALGDHETRLPEGQNRPETWTSSRNELSLGAQVGLKP